MTLSDQGQESTEDKGSKDTGEDTGSEDAGSEDTGSEDTGSESTEDQSGGADNKALTLEEIAKLVPGLQKSLGGLTKGYTQSRQDIALINKNLTALTEALNKKSGAEEGDDDYVTKKDMKNILTDALKENASSANKQKEENDTYIDTTLNELRAEGVITSDEDEKALITHAVKIEQPDLRKAAKSLAEVKKAGAEAVKKAAQKQAKQDEGSGVGDSSGSTGSEQGGVDYAKLKKMQENDDFT